MRYIEQKQRHLTSRLPSQDRKTVILLTGARQTGKTTLAKEQFPSLTYINFDSTEDRLKAQNIPAASWAKTVGNAVIDEVQKEPSILEKVKYSYDAGDISFSVLLGSSQILLLKQVRESMAGRVSIYELFPLTMSELYANGKSELSKPLIHELLMKAQIETVLKNAPPILFGEEEVKKKESQTHLLDWGGMPALLPLGDQERKKWLKDYEYTYLERDLSDLARLHDLQPFRTFQQITSHRSGKLLNYSELARDTGISVDTARRFLEYLRISYQVFFLRPYFQNSTKSLVKTPKLYWLDLGILRQISGCYRSIDGYLFETMVVSEIHKWIKTYELEVELYFYRTHTGLELDLLLQTPHGWIGIEIKSRKKVVKKDLRALKEVSSTLQGNWLGGLLIYNGDTIEKIAEPNIWVIPSWRLFT